MPSEQVPVAVAGMANGSPLRLVWRNELDGLTFAIDGAGGSFVKWAPVGSGLDLPAEAARMRWAAPFTPVPRVLDEGADEAGTWLRTAALPGESAVSKRWLAEPEAAVTAIGRGLRAMHDALPVDACPFSWSIGDRVAYARRHATPDRLDPEDRPSLTIEQALARLDEPPPIDRLVVCHGDACAPNTLLYDDGTWSGHVDLDTLGVADRWADLAIATWSLEWNYGPGLDRALLNAYGIGPDPARTAYYRLLWDLGP